MTAPEELRSDIERTRDQLGETVEALVAKADVKARAQHKAAEVKAGAQQKAADTAGQVAQQAKNLTSHLPAQPDKRSAPLIAAGAATLAAATWLLIRRARRAA
jgi:Protein of unknown function (DUF3618)